MSRWNFVSEPNIPMAYWSLKALVGWSGETEKVETRNGKALVLDGPLALTVTFPNERVLFDVERDANPVFHLMEALWMLAGRNDVAFVDRFNSNIKNYSDDGVSFNGAYGHRWRNHFGYDQLLVTVDKLKRNPHDRRVVISMWDGYNDLLHENTKDVPCNTQIMPRIVRGRLNMTTINRSNDMVWGLMGANCVHMTILQEFLAAAIGVKLGTWNHVANNLHVYERHWPLLPPARADFREVRGMTRPAKYPGTMRLVKNPDVFIKECGELCDGKADFFEEPFFDEVVAPMVQSWEQYRNGDMEGALYDASCIGADDWRIATMAWYNRRKK